MGSVCMWRACRCLTSQENLVSGTEAVPQESKDQAAGCYRRSPRGSRRDVTPWGQCWGDPGCSVPLQIDFCCGNSLWLGPSCCWVGRRGSFWEQRCGSAPSLPDTPARVSGSRGSAGMAPTPITLAGSRAGGGGVSSHPELLLLVLSLWSTKRR